MQDNKEKRNRVLGKIIMAGLNKVREGDCYLQENYSISNIIYWQRRKTVENRIKKEIKRKPRIVYCSRFDFLKYSTLNGNICYLLIRAIAEIMPY